MGACSVGRNDRFRDPKSLLTRLQRPASKVTVMIPKTARLPLFALLIAASTHAALAADSVLWDSSGDGLLTGTYNFREVMWRSNADLHRVAIYGSMVFDGNGRY